jgi:hypothetical protein
LTLILSAVFVLALIMGPGPGLYLVNPDPADPDAVRTLGTIPVLYLWALLWFGVQTAVVLTAYFTLWRDDDADDVPGREGERP